MDSPPASTLMVPVLSKALAVLKSPAEASGSAPLCAAALSPSCNICSQQSLGAFFRSQRLFAPPFAPPTPGCHQHCCVCTAIIALRCDYSSLCVSDFSVPSRYRRQTIVTGLLIPEQRHSNYIFCRGSCDCCFSFGRKGNVYGSLSVFPGAGGINRAGAAVPTFLRTPAMIQPHLDMKSFLQFPMETPPPPHSMSLFHNFNTVRTNKQTTKQTDAGMLQSPVFLPSRTRSSLIKAKETAVLRPLLWPCTSNATLGLM